MSIIQFCKDKFSRDLKTYIDRKEETPPINLRSEIDSYKRNYFLETHQHLMNARNVFLLASDGCKHRTPGREQEFYCNHEEISTNYTNYLGVAWVHVSCNMKDCPLIINIIKETQYK
jgi:hypothetical protein